jgi:hypothetical protein
MKETPRSGKTVTSSLNDLQYARINREMGWWWGGGGASLRPSLQLFLQQASGLMVKRRRERFLFHLGYFLHGFSKYTDAFKHNPLSKGNDLRENAVVGAERSMQFFSVVFTRNHGCDLGPTRRDIITVRGQSYVSRLPKY